MFKIILCLEKIRSENTNKFFMFRKKSDLKKQISFCVRKKKEKKKRKGILLAVVDFVT